MASANSNVQMFYTRPSDGASYCFSPVPLLVASKEFLRTGANDRRLAVVNQLTFNGHLLPTLPALSGLDSASCAELLDRKSDQLCSALEDYGSLVVVDGSGYTIVNEIPRIASVNFDETRLVNHRQYSIVFEYESDFGNDKIREFNEDWSFEQQENDTIAATHNVTAVGVSDSGVNSPIHNARNFVLNRIAGASPNISEAVLLRQPYAPALLDITTLGAFNHVLSETSDKTGGSYTATETWVMSSGNYADDRTIEHSFDLVNNVLVESININGSIQGYGDTTFDRLANAKNAFNSVVKGQINFDAVSGVSAKTYSENRFAGSVSYSLTRAPTDPDSQLQGQSISRSIERNEDGSVTQTVTTSASLTPGSSGAISQAINFCFANNFPIDSSEPIFDASLSGNITSVSTQRDDVERSFSLTRAFTDQTTQFYREEYSISREQSTDTSQTTITVEGLVQGLGTESSTKSKDRFASASGAYFNTVEPLIFPRVLEFAPSGTCVNDGAVSSIFGTSPLAGTITYSKTFVNRRLTSNTGILSEEIEVAFTRPGRVVAEIIIPAKADGPVLQDIKTQTGLEKSISITYTMKGNTDTCNNSVAATNAIFDNALTESDILIDNKPSENSRGEKPESSTVFLTSDEVRFNRQTLVFQRSATWKYL